MDDEYLRVRVTVTKMKDLDFSCTYNFAEFILLFFFKLNFRGVMVKYRK